MLAQRSLRSNARVTSRRGATKSNRSTRRALGHIESNTVTRSQDGLPIAPVAVKPSSRPALRALHPSTVALPSSKGSKRRSMGANKVNKRQRNENHQTPQEEASAMDETLGLQDECSSLLLDPPAAKEETPVLDYEDIDKWDADNPQQVTNYVGEIFDFFLKKEVEPSVLPNTSYMENVQVDISSTMRGVLIDWMQSCVVKFGLMSETYFLAVSLVDRFLSKKKVSRQRLQLVGVGALMLGSKYEEIYPPLVSDWEYISGGACSKKEILFIEKAMLNTLEFDLTSPSPLHFLRRYSKAARSDSRIHTLSKYIIEVSPLFYSLLKFKPSEIAASAVYIARSMAHKDPVWNDTLQHYTTYTPEDFMDCARLLNACLGSESDRMNATRKKYSDEGLLAVALIPLVDL